jgi:UDP-N-acetylmuramoyl-L-alanyl-D-glutamate--2,6-diaminopimelate ligase
MRLADLLRALPQHVPAPVVDVRGLAYDSRRVKAGDCFFAIPGEHVDGHDYVDAAFAAGAVAAVVQRPSGGAGPEVVVDSSRRALALCAATFYGHPSRSLELIGVTGTDGKTTTTILIHAMLQAAGRHAGATTTIDVRMGAQVDPNSSRQTTLEALEIQQLLAHMRDVGLGYAVLETSSHGLALDRVLGCEYDIAVITNIAHEHLDFHGTQEAYREAKARLIDLTAGAEDKGLVKTAVLNRDDESFEFLRTRAIARRLTYGAAGPADLRATRVDPTPSGLLLTADTPLGEINLRLQLLGSWNAYNALAAAATGVALGLNLDEIGHGLESVRVVPGRMERVDTGQPYTVVVDYAHTPQSLEKVLRELRTVTRGRLIAVFGSAGERDREKRPLMGEIAARLGDYAVFTDEDPRDEDPARVLGEIAAGAERVGWREGQDFVRIQDRTEAIAAAIAMAADGDTVLLAGKGHEGSILVAGGAKLPWDERAAALDAIKSK